MSREVTPVDAASDAKLAAIHFRTLTSNGITRKEAEFMTGMYMNSVVSVRHGKATTPLPESSEPALPREPGCANPHPSREF